MNNITNKLTVTVEFSMIKRSQYGTQKQSGKLSGR